ncbi:MULTISPECIES: alpha/beta hydrolase [Gordonia]|uniref:Esterase family protein n=2 Tax=Gordonia terrae TaxID=2055 RepID=A0AAD0KGL3_9ACTN|nr:MULTISPECIES: alpha/beta hydrolase family protein [Gordonia]VTR08339.1 esterase [Clostridioides difficile]ANY25420.1 esterase [Gordonia terrae]AWO86171.1 esterase family protein [Gordonia terrae]MCG7633478.1 esterase family protein [Gordonia sp. McavH-238-E]VTS63213.1 Mycolyl transferase 85A [Gordonia terrae]
MLTRARKRLVAGLVALVAVSGATLVAAPPEASAANGCNVEYVRSNAMNRTVPVCIVSAGGGGPKPTLYLLDGLRAPANNSGWLINTDVARYMAGKGTNVAIPFGGAGSFYTDWQTADPRLGVNKWETFLTRELPGYMKARHNSDNRRNGIAGLSMSGTSALNLASRHPNFYKAVASYSGYPTVTLPGFTQGIMASVAEVGGNPFNMWGFYPAGTWFQNDPFLSAGNLAGKNVYVSSGSGVGSKYDSSVNPASANFDPVKFAQMIPLEVAASTSSQIYIGRLALVPGVKLTTRITPDGAHWWDYWQSTFKESWAKTFRPAFF